MEEKTLQEKFDHLKKASVAQSAECAVTKLENIQLKERILQLEETVKELSNG